MYQVHVYSVVAVLVLGGAMSKHSIYCNSGLQGSSMELAENGTLTHCQGLEVLRYGSMEVLKFKLNRTWLESKTPFLEMAFDVNKKSHLNAIHGIANPKQQTYKTRKQSYVDIIVHTDSSRALGNRTEEDNEIDWPSPQAVTNNSKFANFAVYLFPTTDNPVSVNFSAGLKDVSIKRGEPRNVTLSPLSPLVFKYIHDKNEIEQVRVHIKRADNDVKNVTSGCSMVSVQGLNTPVENLEDHKMSKNPWQRMLGQSIIDINVEEYMTGSEKQKRNEFRKGFLVVIRRINEKHCDPSKTMESFFFTADEEKMVTNTMIHEVHFSNRPTATFVNQNPCDEKTIEMIVEISELNRDVGMISYTIFVGMILLILAFLSWEWALSKPWLEKYQWLSMTGNVNYDSGSDTNKRSSVHSFLDADEHHSEETGSTGDKMFGQLEKRIKGKFLAGQKRQKKALGSRNYQQKRRKQTFKNLRLKDLATQCDIILFLVNLYLKSGLYCWLMLLSGIFYTLPVIQLMFGAQEISEVTGSQDLCYYNFLCRHEVYVFLFGRIKDWGNVFSNWAYVFAGILFILVVWRRSHRRRREMVKLYQKNKNRNNKPTENTRICDEKSKKRSKKLRDKSPGAHDDKGMVKMIKKYDDENVAVEFLNQCGIPEQYGIYYAMGGAMIFEGVLSACYHVCPAHESFQFDTTFMYVLVAMIFLKFYQFRHPDIATNAYISFSMIGMSLIFETASYYAPPRYYHEFFCFVYITTAIFAMTHLYLNLYNLTVRDLGNYLMTIQKRLRGKPEETRISISETDADIAKKNIFGKIVQSGNRSRIVLFCLTIIANLGLAVFEMLRSRGSKMKAKGSPVSHTLLLVFGINMSIYVLYYILMKLYYSCCCMKNIKTEFISIRCWIYIMLATLLLSSGLWFYQAKQRTTTVSPSQSRNMNEECYLMIFDHHDIWHFLSASGIFFTMLAALTIEDNNTSMAWNEIHVF